MNKDRYAVEISGWASDEQFFVEQTELEWLGATQKAGLRHKLHEGSLIFIRLLAGNVSGMLSSGMLSPGILSDALPLPYAAMEVRYLPERRVYETVLRKLKPREMAPASSNEERRHEEVLQ